MLIISCAGRLSLQSYRVRRQAQGIVLLCITLINQFVAN